MYVCFTCRQAKPEHREGLINGFMDQARNSLEKEPGCLMYHVIQDKSDANRIWLYEVFRDEEAFQAHTKMPHSIEWAEVSKDWREPPLQGGQGHNIWPPDEGMGV